VCSPAGELKASRRNYLSFYEEARMADAPDLTSNAVRDLVRRTFSDLSAAWQARRYDELEGLFADDIVFALPGFDGRLEGASAVVASYREFMERVTLTAYREESPAVDVWGDTAVVTCRWQMEWLAGGVPNAESGHDVFVFRRSPNTDSQATSWLAVWRTMTFDAPKSTPRAPAE
jgi:ketosteroid isomerase-like protein